MKKSLKIMGLGEYESAMTGYLAAQTALGRLVEFSARAPAGFAGD
jgi:hypothetical protein